MIMKAVVESNDFSAQKVKVRIPTLHKSAGAPGATPSDELSFATICAPPNFEYLLQRGDIVFVDFENNDSSKPVILGVLSSDEASLASCNAELKDLTVDGTLTINGSLSIGDVTEVEISYLSGVRDNIQGQIDVNNSDISVVAKALGVESVSKNGLSVLQSVEGGPLIDRLKTLESDEKNLVTNLEKLTKTVANFLYSLTGEDSSQGIDGLTGLGCISSAITNIEGLDFTSISNSTQSLTANKLDTVIGRAEIMAFWEWTPSSALMSWSSKGNHRTFQAGKQYVGMPYCQRQQSLKTLMEKVGTGGNANSGGGFGPYYGMCCADFICLAWGAVKDSGKPKTSWAPAIRGGNSIFSTADLSNFWDDNRKNLIHELRPGDCLTDYRSHGKGAHASHVELVGEVTMDKIVYSTSAPGRLATYYRKGDLLYSYGKLFEAKTSINVAAAGGYIHIIAPSSSNDYWQEVPEDAYPIVKVTIMHQGGPLAQAYTREAKVGTPISKINKMGGYSSVVRMTDEYISSHNVIMGAYTGKLV